MSTRDRSETGHGVGFLPLMALLMTLLLPGCGGKNGRVEGRVTEQGKGQAVITIEAYLQAERSVTDPPFAGAVTGADGRFSLELPAGEYYLWAKDLSAVSGPRRIAAHTGNPVRIESGGRLEIGDIEIRQVGRSAEPAAGAGVGLKGRVILDGKPVEDAAVMVYAKTRARLAGPGYLALVRSDAEGRFQVDLAPEAYRVAVRKRRGGGAAGFMRAGDYSGVPKEDPVTVTAGGYADLGDLVLHDVDRERLAAAAGRRFQEESGTVLEGVVVGPDGKPRAGQFVFVYRDEGMIGRPDAVIDTAPDGSFTLYLPAGGKYYLGARNTYGGPRKPGEWTGKLAGAADSALEVIAGRRVKGLTIVMEQGW